MRHGHKKLSFFLCRCMFAVYIYIYHMHCPNDSAMIWNYQPSPHQLKLADAKRFSIHFLIEFLECCAPPPRSRWHVKHSHRKCDLHDLLLPKQWALHKFCCIGDKSYLLRERWKHLSSLRAGPKGLCAESVRAVTARRCPHSGEGEDFLNRQPGFFYENS